jgi:hypothetical protein
MGRSASPRVPGTGGIHFPPASPLATNLRLGRALVLESSASTSPARDGVLPLDPRRRGSASQISAFPKAGGGERGHGYGRTLTPGKSNSGGAWHAPADLLTRLRTDAAFPSLPRPRQPAGTVAIANAMAIARQTALRRETLHLPRGRRLWLRRPGGWQGKGDGSLATPCRPLFTACTMISTGTPAA